MANFLGTGKSIGINANTSAFSTNYSFSYFDPYYTVDGVSRGYSVSYNTSDYAELNLASYSTNQLNVSTTYGYQLNENQTLSFNLGYTHTTIDEGFGPVQEIKSSPDLIPGITDYIAFPGRETSFYDPVTGTIYPISDPVVAPISNLPPSAFNQAKGFLDRDGSNFDNLTINISWLESTLNRGLFPTAGGAQSLSLELSIPGSDLAYYRARYYNDHYFPLLREWIVHTRMDLGYGNGYGNTEQLPFFQNFYAGGQGTIRGFERNTLGPRSTFPQQYNPTNSAFQKDADGNIILGLDGFPVLDTNSPAAYVLNQAVDADGIPLFDETGLPILTEKLSRSNLYSGRAAPFGGNVQTTATLELLFPLPFIDDRSRVRSSIFVDAGNVFSSYCTDLQVANNNCSNFDFGQLRYSAGISVSWQSGAFGIMSFSLAKPFNTSNIDQTEIFQFNLGNNAF